MERRGGKDPDEIMQLVNHAFGARRSDETPRLERNAKPIFHVLSNGALTINEVSHLFPYDEGKGLRQYVLTKITDEALRADWKELLSLNHRDYSTQIESVRNCLMRFASSKQLRRLMGTLPDRRARPCPRRDAATRPGNGPESSGPSGESTAPG